MECAAFEVQRLAALANTLLTGTQGAEVLSSLRDHIRTQLHHNATHRSSIGGDVKENPTRENTQAGSRQQQQCSGVTVSSEIPSENAVRCSAPAPCCCTHFGLAILVNLLGENVRAESNLVGVQDNEWSSVGDSERQ